LRILFGLGELVVASLFSPSLGTVQVCNMSASVTIIRIVGIIRSSIRLSASSSRNTFIC